MKIIIRFSVFLIFTLFLITPTSAQKYSLGDFYKVDSIANEAMPKDALALVEKISQQARTDGNSALLIKSAIYRMLFQSYLEENAFDKILSDLRKDISIAKQPEKSILQSLLAESYWNFYQQNQWKISQRTNVQGNIGDDINTWSTRKLIDEITKTYLASLSEIELLQNTKVDILDNVLAGDKNNRIFRPTLYDLLAHRAIDVFTNTQIGLTQEENDQINFNDPIWFADNQTFLNTPLPKNDSSSFYINALQIFKKLAVIHTNNTKALADVNLKRLKFVSLRTGNRDLYVNALNTFIAKNSDTEIFSDALYELASIYQKGEIPLTGNKENLVMAVEMANNAINAYPNSLGAQNAKSLINTIKTQELSLQIKPNAIPNQAIQLHLSFKNLDTVYFKLYKRPIEENYDNKLGSKNNFYNFVYNNNPIKNWFIVVPKNTDYQMHTLVTKIDGLPLGKYVLLAANRNTNLSDALVAYTGFTSTNLVVTDRTTSAKNHEYFVADVNGVPIKGAKIEPRRYNYNNTGIKGQIITTNDLGLANSIETDNINSALVSFKNDSVTVSVNGYFYDHNVNKDHKKVILFTDRAIYRPGQTIYFKGLLVDKQDDKNVILPDEKIDITFEDTNRKEIEEKVFTSNEFGTFQGSFTIPLGKLNGQMRLYSNYGVVYIQVEEYKRPTFEVAFDKLTQHYKLNDSIKVQGKALAFSGYSVSNAQVSYKVFRRAIIDYRTSYSNYYAIYGYSIFNRQQITFGKTTTKDGGKFELSFFAKATEDKLNYAFDVEVTVTDINGETRTKSTVINVGKRDIVLNIGNYSTLFLCSKTDSLNFSVTNLNYTPIKATVNAEWFLLSSPNRLVNKSPFYAENYTFSRDEFIKLFPNDDYNDELTLAKWPVIKTQYQQNNKVDKGEGNFKISTNQLQPGYYKVKFIAKNEQNDTISVDRFITIFDDEPVKIKTSNEWLIATKTYINPNESAEFRISGLSNNSRAYYEIYYKNDVVEKVWLNLTPKQTILKITPKVDYQHGFAVQFTMINNGVIYNSLQNIYILNKKKQLDIKFLTFRDKLQPGEKETWKLQISNKDGEKEMAEMVATLYDASLDDFRRLSWDTYLKTTYNYTNYTWKAYEQLNYGNILWFLRTNVNYGIKVRQYENLNLFGYNYYGGYNYGYRDYINRIATKTRNEISSEAVKDLNKLAQGKLIYGIVLAAEGAMPIPGVSVKSGKLTTTTNKNGVYSIDAKVDDEITFSYIGYNQQKKKVGNLKRIDINLTQDSRTLDQVVTIGYGQDLKRKESSSATIIQANELAANPQKLVLRGNRSTPAQTAVVVEDNTVYNFMSMESYDPKTGIEMVNGKPIYRKSTIIPRSNFNETAFFYPQLKTNENGEIKIEFTIPQSLTRYKMMGFAHTKDLKMATISNELVTQKQLAIAANAPRFFREGDTILFSAKLNNLSGKNLKGDAFLDLKDALTGKTIQILAKGDELKQNFELVNEGNTVLKWKLIIPEGINAITYKIVAQSGKFSDGEEMTIPVLPNAMLVTESMPINVRTNISKTFTMDKLLKSGSSTTLRNQALTFEFTSNPVWYAIQALPYLMEYPYECAEQTFSRFYANSFATGIINSSPKIAAVFKQWQNTNNGEALLSNLEKNPELKSILLEETPWVRNADNETERKKRLATLFDLNRMTYELKTNFEKLEKMQYADGSFPWFAGMPGDRYITQHIVLGIGQLKKLKLIDEKAYPNLNVMLNKAIIYLDNQLIKDYKNEINGKYFGYLPLHYLFARSYTKQINNNADFIKAKTYYINKITANWKTFDSYQLAQTALVLYRNGNKTEPSKIITLLKQTAQQNDEMGMYWAKNTNGWWWYQNPIETQALLIEAFDEVAADARAVEEMKIWLLKNKQTNDWKTTKATAAACYALLMKGYDLLAESNEPEIKLGNKTLPELGFTDVNKEAGTRYQKITISGANVKPEMAKVDVVNKNQNMAWGALHWQYFEQLDKITPANTGIKIKKQLFIQNTTTKGNLLTPITTINSLHIGDLIKVRIEIYCDRDMEYIHLKDMRSSGFEPVNVISKYKYQDGLGYYESTKDASTNFFISYLRKGTYVFEYELRVTHTGNFSNGITSLQSMYAPEFNTHSEGIRISVK